MSRWPFLCQCCVTLGHGERESVCVDCINMLRRLNTIYTHIMLERPQHRDKDPAELMQALYEYVKKLETRHVRKTRGTPPHTQ